ncbi:hypothetical protein [Microvirga puerhi]|uniref:Uncharacterized protein n=1 Tax=Microvirga puerhi TaxID=2876078 RepID=A0ABS7VR42_9HYPH|nr:hypothetical protein [Microvirga puerhi]MBZ6078028.1 hypothetical protein [Microvirga puerhi]
MTDFHRQIADLEDEIDALTDVVERCRKSMIVARGALVAGGLTVGAVLLGLVRPDPIVLIVGIATTLAGIGFYGSSKGTLDETSGRIRALDAQRAEIIDEMDLRTAPLQ